MSSKKSKVLRNACRAMDALDFKYEVVEDGLLVAVIGDNGQVNVLILADDDNMTMNIYCHPMIDLPNGFGESVITELNNLNNTYNNGAFIVSDDDGKIYFKIIQSYFDRVPSKKLILHLFAMAVNTVDVVDGKLKDLIPKDPVHKDSMYQ